MVVNPTNCTGNPQYAVMERRANPMEYRKLGRTGLDVSAIGLGTEYLIEQPQDTVLAVVQKAIAQGVNYFDLIGPDPASRDTMGAAFAGRRQQVLLTAHLGCIEEGGQYAVTRDPQVSEEFFLDYLSRYRTDYADVLFLHNNNSREDWERLTEPGGLLDLARRFQQEGKARFIGLSGHNAAVAQQAVESGYIDVLMFPVSLASHAVPGKEALHDACVAHNVGLVAMKPYAGGNLLRKEHIIYAEPYQMGRTQMGGAPTRFEKAVALTPVQCLSYVLSQVGISTTVPGCKNLDELARALAYWHASEEEKDFSPVLPAFEDSVSGQCVYCNHCLPCPMEIDIGKTLSLLDEAQRQLATALRADYEAGPIGHDARPLGRRSTSELRADYDALPVKASDCVECGDCVERCPFEVDIIAKMRKAAQVFEVGPA
jgi:predicted aldo/keto reductase-like oxidoreductase